MSDFKVKCTGITQGLMQRQKRDAEGQPVKKENGVYVWESCPRWSFTFTICGAAELHGSFNLQTTRPEEAAKYRLDGRYLMTLGAPEMPVVSDPPDGEAGP